MGEGRKTLTITTEHTETARKNGYYFEIDQEIVDMLTRVQINRRKKEGGSWF